MRHHPFRPFPLLSCLTLLLASAACTGQPISPTPLPPALTPQSTISNPQSTILPTPTPLPPALTPQSTISNPQSTIPPTPALTPQSTIINQPSTIPPTLTPQSTITNPQSAIRNPQYFLSARFDFAFHSLSVTETITYTNNTAQALGDLLLIVPANRWPGAFQLREIRWAGGESIRDYTLLLQRLNISLAQPLPPGGTLALSLGYDLTLPLMPEPSDAAPQPFGYTAAQSNLVDWYAYIPPYRDGWLAHDPYYWGEYQVFDESDFRVDLSLHDAPPGMTVAASAQPYATVPGQEAAYRYQLPSARTFALSISPSYRVFSQTVDLGGASVEIYSYAFVFNLAAGKAALDDTARAVQLYSELFGAYPHATLSVVEADFLDGMEYDGLYFLSKGFYNLYDGTPDGYLTAIAVHETAHQWWYGLVGNDQALDPWLDEALCTFTERVFYEHVYPDVLTRWWQPYRVDYYQPAGLMGGRIYDYASYRAYRDAVYLRGQAFLQAVRERIGDEAFFAFLKEYAARFRGQIATRQDFFTLLASHSQAAIDDLMQEYFGAP